jgi:hypothetical protein
VRVALRAKYRKFGEKLLVSMRIYTPALNQSSNGSHHFNVEQMRNNDRFIL